MFFNALVFSNCTASADTIHYTRRSCRSKPKEVGRTIGHYWQHKSLLVQEVFFHEHPVPTPKHIFKTH